MKADHRLRRHRGVILLVAGFLVVKSCYHERSHSVAAMWAARATDDLDADPPPLDSQEEGDYS